MRYEKGGAALHGLFADWRS